MKQKNVKIGTLLLKTDSYLHATAINSMLNMPSNTFIYTVFACYTTGTRNWNKPWKKTVSQTNRYVRA